MTLLVFQSRFYFRPSLMSINQFMKFFPSYYSSLSSLLKIYPV